MRKGLTIICAALLATSLAACKKSGGNSDEDRLNAAAAQLDSNGVYDTSADDAAMNQAELPADQAGPGNGAAPTGNVAANAPAPAGNAAASNGAAAATNRR
ncbi:hypothetical protein [Allosphingosinicella sp.]|uniref:hypothetical protein n=1 Tax=Allosphingosinicella sp. TaxID=2823234 RepID=UPI0037841CBA